MNELYPKIVLKPGRERSLINRHPWLFSGAIKNRPQDLKEGAIVHICNFEGTPLAFGHFCGETSLICRLFCFDVNTLIDEGFFWKRFHEATKLRSLLRLKEQQTTGFRLIHGEGDQLPGLICDIFHETASIQVSHEGMASLLPLIASFLEKELHLTHIHATLTHMNESRWLKGKNEASQFLENGIRFTAQVSQGQKTGHFLDQRDNRKLLGFYAKGRNVCDAFCYSGGFTTYALKNEAAHVTSVDISAQALAECKAHLELNHLANGRHEALKEDCFSYLRHIKPNSFDLMILDPPAFAKSASHVEKAARGYKDINLSALKALKPGSLLFTFSCSQHISKELFQKIIFAAAKDAFREVRILHELTQGADHPVSIFCPEGSYLKGLLLYIS